MSLWARFGKNDTRKKWGKNSFVICVDGEVLRSNLNHFSNRCTSSFTIWMNYESVFLVISILLSKQLKNFWKFSIDFPNIFVLT